MSRIILALATAILLIAGACGGSDEPETAPTSTATSAADATEAARRAEATAAAGDAQPTADASSASDGDLGGVLSLLFNSGLGGATGRSGLPGGGITEGDPSLLQYLLGSADVPAGYTSAGEFSFRVPDGISESGGGDMAASMFMQGDFASGDFEGAAMLMSMVMKFDDLQDLKDTFAQTANVSKEDIIDAIQAGAGELPGIEFRDLELLDTSGLGEGAFGLAITMDMGGLLDSLGDLAGEDVAGAPDLEALSEMRMRMYFFERNDLVGAVMHIGFGASSAAGVDDLALAKALDARLAGAQ